MLLSRVADALYWISRYLERAEHTARVVDVAADLGLDWGGAVELHAIRRLHRSLGATAAGDDPAALVAAALFGPANRNSGVACVSAARENARQVCEEISSEMWEQVNALFLRVRQMRDDGSWAGRTHYVARSIIEGVHLVTGTADATMGHGEGWQYLQVGRFLERAAATATLLDAFVVADEAGDVRAPLDQADWVALLRACAALEGYSRHYTADVRPERVIEFLLLDAESPRSIRFAATQVEAALRAIARHGGRSAGTRAERLSGRLRAMLDYGQVDEILSEDPHGHLVGVSRQCAQIHAALYQTYIAYPIESALPA
jgi:uncharacterized alpha-E superfamily protein